ncbi:Protein of unknown function [Cotesia congregata]|uniref:Uncharacterized protein n=1 Tax=Cotesia congregata TaxID=51543 RepID=A0A8J2EIZ7_COTCN|nr:Protein of unknown function [Cotesia congregata]
MYQSIPTFLNLSTGTLAYALNALQSVVCRVSSPNNVITYLDDLFISCAFIGNLSRSFEKDARDFVAISTGIDAAVVINPEIIELVKWSIMFSSKYPKKITGIKRPSAVIRIKATSAGVPTKAPTQPAAIPRPALTKKLGYVYKLKY